jgi:hypothetical protein
MKDVEFKGTPKKPMRVGIVQTIDPRTGEVIAERRNAMTLMPARDGVCPECAVDHPHDQPHNQQSLIYQYRFHATHGRFPVWTDAMAHCPDAVKAAWREKLIEVHRGRGLDVPDDLAGPMPAGR